MSRVQLVILGDHSRQKAMHWAARAPIGTRIEFKEAKRTAAQNDRMWAMLTDIAAQVTWHGSKLSTETWKLIFLDALRREIGGELRIVPNLDGDGFVNVGTSSSDLSKDEMTMLIELIFKFGAEHQVKFQEPAEQAA